MKGLVVICEKGIKSSTSPDNVDDSLGDVYGVISYSSFLSHYIWKFVT